jgi:hypothetical protein
MALSPPISKEQRRRQRRKIPQFAVGTRRNQCRELLAHDTLHGEKLSIGRNEVKRRDFFTLAIGAARKDQTMTASSKDARAAQKRGSLSDFEAGALRGRSGVGANYNPSRVFSPFVRRNSILGRLMVVESGSLQGAVPRRPRFMDHAGTG